MADIIWCTCFNFYCSISPINREIIKYKLELTSLKRDIKSTNSIKEADIRNKINIENRISEIKRIGAKGENIDKRGAVWNCPGLVLQFPQGEMASNTSFQRNPEGGCN